MASRKGDRKTNLAWRRFFSMANGRKRRALARKLTRKYKPVYFNSPEF